MDRELIKQLVDVSPFDTARNVYYVIFLSKEMGKNPAELASGIKQVRLPNPKEKVFAKLLFDALIDCKDMTEQIDLLSRFFSYEDKSPYEALGLALNEIDSNGLLQK